MAENITLNNIATFQNDTSAANTYNNNNTAIVNAFADVLSRSGVGPNQMQSTLDMNNQQIINLPAPTTAGSPARLLDISGGQITVVTATTGTSGHTVPFLDGANIWSAPQTITTTGQLTPLTINNTLSGSLGGNFNSNIINVNDTANAVAGFVNGVAVNDSFGGSTVFGGRQGIFSNFTMNSATAPTNTNRNYTSISGIVNVSTGDNGASSASLGTSAGIFLGGLFTTNASSAATNLSVCSSVEFNTSMASGSSTWLKSLANFAGGSSDVATGTGVNAMLYLYNLGNSAKWTNAVFIDNLGGNGFWPINANGTIFKTAGNGTAASGIDISNTTFSVNAFNSTGFIVTGTGVLTLGSVGGAAGTINLNGSTSGTFTLVTNSTGNQLTISPNLAVGFAGSGANAKITFSGNTSGFINLTTNATGTILNIDQQLSVGSGGSTGTIVLNGSTSGTVTLSTPSTSGGLLQFASAGSFSPNAAVATVLGSVGPTGSHTAVQKWLTIVDNGGVTGYIPVF